MKHGINSSLILDADAAREIEYLREVKGYLWLEECDANVLYTMVRAMVRFRRIDEYIENHEIDEIKPYIWQQVSRESNEIRDSARALAFSSVDRAALMKDGAWARALRARTSGPRLGERGAALRAERGRSELPSGRAVNPMTPRCGSSRSASSRRGMISR
ncbi:MAG: hypothetical protein WB565_07225 [Acidimicrobiales bacterium]